MQKRSKSGKPQAKTFPRFDKSKSKSNSKSGAGFKSRSPSPARGPRPAQKEEVTEAKTGAGNELTFPRHWRAIVGTHAINEALKTHAEWAELLWLQQGFESNHELKTLHTEYRNKINKVETKPIAVLDKLAHSHQGAALFLNRSPEVDWDQLLAKPQARVLLLDGLEDPHNLGAILRTAWLMQVDAVLLPQDRSVRLSPIVHKVACGGVEHVPVHICGQFNNVMDDLKQAGFWSFGLSHNGKQDLFQVRIPEKIVWCIGAEDKGLRTTTERLCDELVRIPQASAAASYNASVATGMALVETYRQQLSLPT